MYDTLRASKWSFLSLFASHLTSAIKDGEDVMVLRHTSKDVGNDCFMIGSNKFAELKVMKEKKKEENEKTYLFISYLFSIDSPICSILDTKRLTTTFAIEHRYCPVDWIVS